MLRFPTFRPRPEAFLLQHFVERRDRARRTSFLAWTCAVLLLALASTSADGGTDADACDALPRADLCPLNTPRGIGRLATQARQTRTRWSWPTERAIILRPWEAPATRYAAGHRGVDVPAPADSLVHAPDDGVIAFAGAVAGRHVVTIDHGGGLVSTLDPVTPSVHEGTTVQRGDVIGVAEAGHCSRAAPCVHLGARVNDDYTDPTPFLPAAEWPVLLPLL